MDALQGVPLPHERVYPVTTEITRRDRYTILVDGHPIRATPEQEARIRQMDADQIKNFLALMGAEASTSIR